MAKYFVYTRKSSETEDRQVLSLESQENELKAFIKKENLEVVEFLGGESKSAKQPGRPIFDRMIKRIERGEADGIIAWHPDRLARNSVDGGKIIYLLDTGKLNDLKFPLFSFENSSQGKFMLNIFFGQSKYYVDNLSENVKRGNKTKLEKGWRPGFVPLGYKNNIIEHTIEEDPDRFEIIKKLWDMFISGAYSVPALTHIANEEFGLRSRKNKLSAGKKLGHNTLYNIFANPFYCGLLRHGGKVYPGIHPAMVSVEQFDKVQEMLGRKSRPKPQEHNFAFTGMIRCGECGSMVTAEHKVNRQGHNYIYYHCTKRAAQIDCSQKCIRIEGLETQIKKAIDEITISDKMANWAVSYLRKTNQNEISQRVKAYKAQQKAYNDCQRELDELTKMRFKHLVSDVEYSEWKEKLLMELLRLKETLNGTEHRASRWLELAEKAFVFANKAKYWFERGTTEQKREILQAIGSNLVLKDGFLHVQLEKPYCLISKSPKSSKWLHKMDIIRTFFHQHEDDWLIVAFIKIPLGLLRLPDRGVNLCEYYPVFCF